MSAINKPPPQKKVRLLVHLSEDEKQRVRWAAAVMGQTVNSLAVSHLVERASEIIVRSQKAGKPRDRSNAIPTPRLPYLTSTMYRTRTTTPCAS